MSGSFRDQNFSARFKEMGDIAEGNFERYAADLGLGFVRYGLNRPPIRLASVPARLRYSPDYLMSNRFVEVQGLGKDQVAKFKLEKLNCAHWWNDVHPLHFYIWDSHHERECMFHLFELDRLINEGRSKLGYFHDNGGTAYFAFAADDLFALGDLELAA